MKDSIDQIRTLIPISKIITRYVHLSTKGNGEFKGLCPFHHEKTPSFSVSDSKGVYYCFGCQASGDIFTFLQEKQGMSFKEALKSLCDEAGIKFSNYSNKSTKSDIFISILKSTMLYYRSALYSTEGNIAMNYLKNNRYLKKDIIDKFDLGYAPKDSSLLFKHLLDKNYKKDDILESKILLKGKYGKEIYNPFQDRIIFPILNRQRNVIGFGGRIVDETKHPKYLNSSESILFQKSKQLYNINNILSSNKEILLVEGYMDVISLSKHGITNAVAPLGASISIPQILTLWNLGFDEPIICMDNDTAGIRATSKIAFDILEVIKPGKSLKFLTLHDGKDPDEILRSKGLLYFKSLINRSTHLVDLLFNIEQNITANKTPEQRSAFKKRLLEITNRINDNDIKTHYKHYFMNKFSELFFKTNKQKIKHIKIYNEESAVLDIINRTKDYRASIIAVLLKYPSLLKDCDIYNSLINLEIPMKALDIARNFLLSLEGGEDSIKCLSFLESGECPLGVKSIIEREQSYCMSMGFYSSYDIARDYLMRNLKLNDLSILQSEMDVARNSFISDNSSSNYERLLRLKKQCDNLKTELEEVV